MSEQLALYKTVPFEHQLQALRKAKGKRGFMFSMEQGTGKTWVVINEVAQLWGEGKINGLLVFADNGVHVNWTQAELPKHMPDWVRWKAVAWNSAAPKPEERKIEAILGAEDSGVLRILTVNWDALAHKRPVEFIERFMNSCSKLGMVGDESQGIANPSSRRTKQLEKLKMQAVYRRTMTGTPVLNGPFDLFAQYRFLDPTILQTTSFVAFRAEYADMIPAPQAGIKRDSDSKAYAIMRRLPKGTPFPQVVDEDPITGLPTYKNLDKLARLVEPFTFRVLKSECLDLPEKVYTQTFFELDPKQRAAYRKMAIEFRFIVANEEASVDSKLVALSKLTQITSGFLMTPEDGTQSVVDVEDDPKVALLRERLQQSVFQLGNQVIVWYHNTEAMFRIIAACEQKGAERGCSFVIYNGQTSKEHRTAAIDAFQNGRVQVFIVQIQTGSTGITLTAASHVIYYQNTFSYGDRSQSEDRAHRIGQTKNVLYEDLIARGTRDMAVVEALRTKKNLADVINGDSFLEED